jgi:flagellar hook-associated protein 2
MGRITSSVGLISGLPITDLVNQLMTLQARPRDLLVSRTQSLQSQQTALSEITGLLLSVQITARNLAKADLFQQRTVASSNSDVLSATVTGTPALGTSTFTPLAAAQAHQVVSSGLPTNTEPLGAGTVSFRFGGFLDEGLSLDLLGGGAGLSRGKIRVTDRSGASAEIDLRYARTIDDVLAAINDHADIDVSAVTVGDRIRLIDGTGQTAVNLRVQEVGGGTTAASLGLSGINVAASQADGSDVLRLYEGLGLSQLNDRNGVVFDEALSDLTVQFRDGTTRTVDFRPVTTTSLYATGTTTAAAGTSGQVKFTASTTGSSLAGVNVVFENDDGVTAGNETVVYSSVNQTLTFKIDEGNTTAADIVAALNGDATASGFFTASLVGTGAGVIDVADTATTALPATVPDEQTLGDVLATLNAVAPSKLQAELSGDGDRIVLTDLTTGGGTFQITAPNGSPALEQLGLSAAAAGGVITGDRLLGGLKTTLLSSLGGGAGLGTLGEVDLTDRDGATATVNLAAAETLDEVVAAINAAAVDIEASVNAARNGIVLTDTSGGTGSLIVANGDATNTADALKIAVNGAVGSVNSGSLDKQTVSRNTLLSSLGGGAGVAKGSIKVIGSDGATFTVNLSSSTIQTIGDVIDKINVVTTGVEARINETGDGILLIDTAEGAGTLRVEESGGRTAADLHILGSAVEAQVDGDDKLVIDGSTTFRVTLDADDTLTDLVSKVNALGVGITASQFSDGSSVNPFRLLLASQRSGKAGELLVDASALGLTFTDSVAAQDALLLFGAPSASSVGTFVASSSNTFADVLPGVSLTVKGPSTSPVNVTVSGTDSNLVATAIAFVDGYNRLRDKLDELTAFNEETSTGALLLGDGTTLRLQNDLADLLSGAIAGAGPLRSLETVGISLTEDGKLLLDQAKFQAQFAADPAAVQSFFSTDELGFADRFDQLAEQLAGEENSLLASRLTALERKVLDNQQRIDAMNARLDRSRERTLLEFARLEETISRIQSSLSVLDALAPVPPLVSTGT